MAIKLKDKTDLAATQRLVSRMATVLQLTCIPDTPRHERMKALCCAGFRGEYVNAFLADAEFEAGLEYIPPPQLVVIKGGKQ